MRKVLLVLCLFVATACVAEALSYAQAPPKESATALATEPAAAPSPVAVSPPAPAVAPDPGVAVSPSVVEVADKAVTWGVEGVFALLAWLVVRYLTQSAVVKRALSEVMAAVLKVKQTYVDEIRRGLADDGKLSPEERATAKRLAIEEAKSNLGTKGLAALGRIVGVDVEGWLGSKVESALGDLKLAAAKPAASGGGGASVVPFSIAPPRV